MTMRTPVIALLSGVLVLVLGLVLATTVLSQAATAGSSTNIGSFSGVQSINDLVPLIFYFGLIFMGLGLMGVGGAGIAGRGPLRG